MDTVQDKTYEAIYYSLWELPGVTAALRSFG